MIDYGLKCTRCGSRLLCGKAEQSKSIPAYYIIDSPVCENYKECGVVHTRIWIEKDKIPKEVLPT